jgi:hypothetical protein
MDRVVTTLGNHYRGHTPSNDWAFCCAASAEGAPLMLPNSRVQSKATSCRRAPRQQQRLG